MDEKLQVKICNKNKNENKNKINESYNIKMSKLLPISIKYLPQDPPSYRVKIKNVKDLINSLPNELKIKIYKEYLEPIVYYSLYNEALLSKTSKLLNIANILPYIPIINSKPLVLRHVNNNCQIFRKVYNRHKIENKKNFIKMSKGESFALSILFYAYH